MPTAAASPATDKVGMRAGEADRWRAGRGNASVLQPHQLVRSAFIHAESVSQLPCIKFEVHVECALYPHACYIAACYNGARLYITCLRLRLRFHGHFVTV